MVVQNVKVPYAVTGKSKRPQFDTDVLGELSASLHLTFGSGSGTAGVAKNNV